nr:MAG TPA: hypothetical protein [Caudoviricetes sp.]
MKKNNHLFLSIHETMNCLKSSEVLIAFFLASSLNSRLRDFSSRNCITVSLLISFSKISPHFYT